MILFEISEVTMAERQDPAPVPDPARSYERAKPEFESGAGRLSAPRATPTNRPDVLEQTVENAHPPRQINTDSVPARWQRPEAAPPEQPDHSMYDEEPDGWDLAPNDIHNPREKRHPRKEGRGGTP
jgi:hypothetical protein